MRSYNTRREFLKTTSLAAASLATGSTSAAAQPQKPGPAQTVIPRWRGFNMLSFFQAFSPGEQSDGMVSEDDLRWMRDWGFDFTRIPMDYWLWVDSDWQTSRQLKPDDVLKIKESTLEKVDRTVDLGKRYGLHVNLNFHRAPGYCVNNREREPFVLWTDKQAEDAFVYHWDVFAQRYKGISSSDLSFNLVNEAPRPREGYMSREDYRRVMTRATEKVRETSPERLIIIDGFGAGNLVVDEMIPTGVAQSVHGYYPGRISHFRASWVDRESKFREPTWPLLKPDGSVELDRAGLEKHYTPWAELARQGIGVHCGECGGYNKTPYGVFMGWFEDVMDILKTHGIGYALWNFRGSFGILDSGRADVEYEDWHGHKLDRKLLTMLQKY